MSEVRLFLPFTHGVDAQALTHALTFAKAAQATVVAVALIPLPQQAGVKGPRLERIQQAKDFLEFMRTKAEFYHVTLERHEIYTRDVVEQVTLSVQHMECQGLILVRSERDARFSLMAEAAQLVQHTLPFPLYIVSRTSETKNSKRQSLLRRLVAGISQWRSHQPLIPLHLDADEKKTVKGDRIHDPEKTPSLRR